MKLEVGKLYQTRDGRKCFISSYSDDITKVNRFMGIISGSSCVIRFSNDGKFLGYEESPFDLISEWPSTPAKNPVIYDRSLLPAWANKAIAMLEGGEWMCFDRVPYVCGGAWTMAGDDSEVAFIPPSYAPQWSGDWKDSLLVFEDQ